MKESKVDPSDLKAIHAKSAQTKRNKLSFKEKAFAREYVKNRGNGVQAVLKTYDTNDPNVAGNIAHENVRKPKVKEEIYALLRQNGIEIDEILTLHARNARQDKHLPTSQKAIGDFYEILGMKHEANKSSAVNVAFIIEG